MANTPAFGREVDLNALPEEIITKQHQMSYHDYILVGRSKADGKVYQLSTFRFLRESEGYEPSNNLFGGCTRDQCKDYEDFAMYSACPVLTFTKVPERMINSCFTVMEDK